MNVRLVLLIVSLFVGCSAANKASNDNDIFEGFFTAGFEDFTFHPCGSTERWCIVGNNYKAMGDLQREYNKIARKSYEEVYVRLRGELWPEKPEVSTNPCERNFLLKEVLLVRAKDPKDCQH
jgi:hypothetical protein